MSEEIQNTDNLEEQTPAPVCEQARINSIDVLRGFALLGILAMNIYAFALPQAAYKSMVAFGGTTGIDRIIWYITHLFFDQKMMTIFSMLFGASLILMKDRFEESGREFKGFYFRRTFWLVIIALIHAYLIWWGDILFFYGVIGFIIYLFRNLRAKNLIIIGSIILLIGVFAQGGIGLMFSYMRDTATEAQTLLDEGKEITDVQEQMLELWPDIGEEFTVTEESLDEEITAYQSNYMQNLKYRIPGTIMMQTQVFIFYMLWRVGAVMLIGMGLMKLGIFSASRSRKCYLIMMIIGYGLSIPLIYYGATLQELHNFDLIYWFREGGLINYLFSTVMALGHIGLVMLVCKSNLLSKLKEMLSSVGRMALTNYLFHSVIFTTIFYGFGLGLFAKYNRSTLMLFVIGMWIFQMLVSPLWLKHFRFGPAEWLWRSLTYKKRQPMKR